MSDFCLELQRVSLFTPVCAHHCRNLSRASHTFRLHCTLIYSGTGGKLLGHVCAYYSVFSPLYNVSSLRAYFTKRQPMDLIRPEDFLNSLALGPH